MSFIVWDIFENILQMKDYKINRKLKNLQKREREGMRNMFFLLLGLISLFYFIFQILDAVSTNEFIFTMHHDNNKRCEKNKWIYKAKLNFTEIIVS